MWLEGNWVHHKLAALVDKTARAIQMRESKLEWGKSNNLLFSCNAVTAHALTRLGDLGQYVLAGQITRA